MKINLGAYLDTPQRSMYARKIEIFLVKQRGLNKEEDAVNGGVVFISHVGRRTWASI